MTAASQEALDTSTRRLLAMSWPLALHGLVNVIVAANDVVLLGGEGARVIASAVVASSILTVTVMTVTALTVGTQIEASRARGAGDDATARLIVQATFRLVVTLAAPMVVGGWLIAPRLVGLVGGEAVDADLAGDYLRLTLLGVPLALVAAVLRSYATALGRTRVVLVAGLLTAGTDIAVSLALVPVLGWKGVAIGTVCGYLISAAAYLVWRLRLKDVVRPTWSLRRTGLERRLFDLGWPESLLALFSTASGVVVVLVLADSTSEVLAAARVLDVQLMLAWVVMYSVGQALLTILSQAQGAGRDDLFAAALRGSVKVFAGGALVLYVVGAPLSGWLVSLAGGSAVADEVGALGWLAWGQIVWMAACACLVSICRSLRDTRASLIASLVGEYAVFLPLGLVLCRWQGLDVVGVLVAHHAFWLTFVGVVAWRARIAWGRSLESEAA